MRDDNGLQPGHLALEDVRQSPAVTQSTRTNQTQQSFGNEMIPTTPLSSLSAVSWPQAYHPEMEYHEAVFEQQLVRQPIYQQRSPPPSYQHPPRPQRHHSSHSSAYQAWSPHESTSFGSGTIVAYQPSSPSYPRPQHFDDFRTQAGHQPEGPPIAASRNTTQAYPSLNGSLSPLPQPTPPPAPNLLDWCRQAGYVAADQVPPGRQRRTWRLERFLCLPPVRYLTRGDKACTGWHPGTSRRFNNWYALFCQVAGVPAPAPCDRCAGGKGMWDGCIVAPTAETDDIMHGACAACFFSDQGSRCSLARPRGM